ncbi:MAG: helix-turn-helix transcriptional regulator [Terriglobia bacterium]|nr:helix-turn-helix transcriptional regulator [Terriglobia bacterium]
MSMVLINPSAPDQVFYTHLFGRFVRDRRRKLNLTVEQAAELTGITSSEWIAIEAGYVPQEYKMVRTISETLEVRTSDLLMASIMSTLAQEQTVQ